MRMRRFTGTDMRDALRQVREALGADAVILETTRTAAGVEISAAMDGDAADLTATATDYRSANRGGSRIDFQEDSDHYRGSADTGSCVVVDGPSVPTGAWYQPPRPAAAGEMDRLREEVNSLRTLLEGQLSRLVWDQQARQSPEVAGLLRHLAQLGLDADIARELADRATADGSPGNWTVALRTIVNALPVSDRDITATGGVFAVVGPTGVGKTTTIAKLAARAALQFGPDAVGLVTTDSFRVAAREQLETYGHILGVPVRQVADSQSLQEALSALRDRRLVLVDTAGMSQRDPRLQEQLLRLGGTDIRVDTLLALPANVHPGTLREIVDAFRTAHPVAGILTKTDEATSLGGAFSVVIRAGLPLAYVANGQRVPEDLHVMRDRQTWLAKMAVELMRRENRPPDDESMARRFTEVAAHAYA